MILITGATGFVGRSLIRRLATSGQPVGCLVRPARKERRFPAGVRLHIAVGDVDDPPALRAAMQDVGTIIHLAGLQAEDQRRTFESINHQGTRNVVAAAHDAGVKRLIYLSQIGADAGSAYPFWRSKGLAEGAVQASGLDYTIIRASTLYGEDDDWVNNIVMALKSIPWVFPTVGDGQARLQPLWVEDASRCLAGCLNGANYTGRTLDIGGPEYFSLDELIDLLASRLKVRRRKVHLRLPLAIGLANAMRHFMMRPLLTQTIIDGLNVNTTTDLTAIQREFGFAPARLAESTAYMHGKSWRREFLRRLLVGV